MKQWLDFWEKCKGKKGSPVLIGLLVGLLLLVITWPDNSSKKQNTQTKTNAPAVENNVRNTEDLHRNGHRGWNKGLKKCFGKWTEWGKSK